MSHMHRLRPDQLKVLADPRRLAMLRRLMRAPATLSQLGREVNQHPAWVRHHLKQLEQVGLVRMTDTRPVRGFVEKYYQATAPAYLVQMTITPAYPEGEVILVTGSHDPALDLLARHLAARASAPAVIPLPLGSLDGLIALRQGVGHVAGCHLLDPDTGEYNRPYVRYFLPEQPTVLVTLAHRQQGLLVAPGNPKGIRGVEDLARPDVVMVNRNRGSGTRLWLEHRLRRLDISTDRVQGYEREVNTHDEVAAAVARGEADVGLGVLAVAQQFGLEVIPLFEERYDLVIPRAEYESDLLRPLLDYLHAAAFRRVVEGLAGYDVARTGVEVVV